LLLAADAIQRNPPTGKSWLPRSVTRWHIDRFVARVAATLPAGVRILDAGAGSIRE
jgi:hypothetical protein